MSQWDSVNALPKKVNITLIPQEKRKRIIILLIIEMFKKETF
jgi:hypothetical protein